MELKDLIVDVEPSMGDNTARVVSVRYEEGAFVFTDSAGMLPQPGLAPGFPGGNSCVQAGPRAVRCPADLSDPAIHGTSFDVRTFGGDDRIDLRGMPDLPGGMLSGSAEVDLNGPARGQGSGVASSQPIPEVMQMSMTKSLLLGAAAATASALLLAPASAFAGPNGADQADQN